MTSYKFLSCKNIKKISLKESALKFLSHKICKESNVQLPYSYTKLEIAVLRVNVNSYTIVLQWFILPKIHRNMFTCKRDLEISLYSTTVQCSPQPRLAALVLQGSL